MTGSRITIEADTEFATYFRLAREEIAKMDVQYIQLDDPIERTLFEIYAALTLATDEFNSFETH
jgi:hypothetical protein